MVLVALLLVAAVAGLHGPFGRTGAEPAVFAGGLLVLLTLYRMRPRRALFFAGVGALAAALAGIVVTSAPGDLSDPPRLAANLAAHALLALGWGALWWSVAPWWTGPLSYLAIGAMLLATLFVREGADFSSLLSLEGVAFRLVLPLVLWPAIVFGAFGLFGVLF